MVMRSPSRIAAIGPPRAASGATWPTHQATGRSAERPSAIRRRSPHLSRYNSHAVTFKRSDPWPDGRPRRARSGFWAAQSPRFSGDRITIDHQGPQLELEISDAEIARRLEEWKPQRRATKTGVFAKYAALVSSAAEAQLLRPTLATPSPDFSS